MQNSSYKHLQIIMLTSHMHENRFLSIEKEKTFWSIKFYVFKDKNITRDEPVEFISWHNRVLLVGTLDVDFESILLSSFSKLTCEPKCVWSLTSTFLLPLVWCWSLEVDGRNALHTLSQSFDSSSLHFGKQCVSGIVKMAVEDFSSTGITFKLGILIFFAESEWLILLPLNTPHKKNNIFQPAKK